MSDQTDREAPWGEIDETTLIRNGDGTLSLGRAVDELEKAGRAAKREADIQRLLWFLEEHPGGSDTELITGTLAMFKSYFLELAGMAREQLYTRGKGVKGDPKLYFAKSLEIESGTEIETATQAAEEIIREYI